MTAINTKFAKFDLADCNNYFGFLSVLMENVKMINDTEQAAGYKVDFNTEEYYNYHATDNVVKLIVNVVGPETLEVANINT